MRIVIDEVILGQLNTVLMQSAHREPAEGLLEHYGLLAKVTRVLSRDRGLHSKHRDGRAAEGRAAEGHAGARSPPPEPFIIESAIGSIPEAGPYVGGVASTPPSRTSQRPHASPLQPFSTPPGGDTTPLASPALTTPMTPLSVSPADRYLPSRPAADRKLSPSTRRALLELQAALQATSEGSELPADYPGLWFGIVHGDLHGGNIMVDSRSYAWLIDYGEVEDAHVFKDPAKLEASIAYQYTTMPMPPEALLGASPLEVRWWLSVPLEVAEATIDQASRLDAVGGLSMEQMPSVLRAACADAGECGKRVDVEEVMLRFAPAAECDVYLSEGCAMMDLLLPFRDLNLPIPCTFTPPFLTKERLRLCWEQVLQIRGLLPQSSCRPHKTDTHPYDSHPMQYAVRRPQGTSCLSHAATACASTARTYRAGAEPPPPAALCHPLSMRL